MLNEDYEVLDTKTGEIITDKVNEQLKREEERRKKANEYFREQEAKRALHKGSSLNKHSDDLGGFVWANFTPLVAFKEQYPGLIESHYARLMYMSTFLKHDSEQLKTDNNRPIKKKEIRGMLGLTETPAKKFIKEVTAHGLLSFDDENNVYIHNLFTKGRSDSRGYTRTRMYVQTVRKLYELVDGRNVKKLGVIFSVIPFIDFRLNILAHNADKGVKDSSELIIMTMADLAKELGFSDARRLKETLHSFKIDGQRIVHTANDTKGKSIIIVNPKFVYAGNHEDFEKLNEFDGLTLSGLFFNNKRKK